MGDAWDDDVETPAIPAVTTPELPEIRLFGKWSLDDVQLSDMSLSVSRLYG